MSFAPIAALAPYALEGLTLAGQLIGRLVDAANGKEMTPQELDQLKSEFENAHNRATNALDELRAEIERQKAAGNN